MKKTKDQNADIISPATAQIFARYVFDVLRKNPDLGRRLIAEAEERRKAAKRPSS